MLLLDFNKLFIPVKNENVAERLANGNSAGKRGLHNDFYPGSLFLKSYALSFAQRYKDFH